MRVVKKEHNYLCFTRISLKQLFPGVQCWRIIFLPLLSLCSLLKTNGPRQNNKENLFFNNLGYTCLDITTQLFKETFMSLFQYLQPSDSGMCHNSNKIIHNIENFIHTTVIV